jgi:hypothetical protein
MGGPGLIVKGETLETIGKESYFINSPIASVELEMVRSLWVSSEEGEVLVFTIIGPEDPSVVIAIRDDHGAVTNLKKYGMILSNDHYQQGAGEVSGC